MDEKELFSRIHELVDEEHKLRESGEHTEDQRTRLTKLEADLDQCWDLLRQRRAHEEFNQDPDEAQARPVSQVEGYVQ